MTEPKQISGWTPAIIHYLLAGLVMPLVVFFASAILFILLGGREVVLRLAALTLADALTGNLVSMFKVYWLLVMLPIEAAAFYFGTVWSTAFLQKRYGNSDREQIIRRALLIYLIMGLLLFLSAAFIPTGAGISFPLQRYWWPLSGLIINGVFFYVVARLFFLREEPRFRQLPLVLVVAVFASLFGAYLALSSEQSAKKAAEGLLPKEERPVAELTIIPFEDVLDQDAASIAEILREEFPHIPVRLADQRPLPPILRRDNQPPHGIAAWYVVEAMRGRESSPFAIGITRSELLGTGINPPSQQHVFSIVQRGSNTVLISTYHLRGTHPGGPTFSEALLAERLRKVLLRGIGIAFGLEDVTDVACVMAPAKSLAELDQKGSRWCEDEKEKLLSLIQQRRSAEETKERSGE